MKKFGILLVLCSLGMFTIGCSPEAKKDGGSTKGGTMSSTGSSGGSSASTEKEKMK